MQIASKAAYSKVHNIAPDKKLHKNAPIATIFANKRKESSVVYWLAGRVNVVFPKTVLAILTWIWKWKNANLELKSNFLNALLTWTYQTKCLENFKQLFEKR